VAKFNGDPTKKKDKMTYFEFFRMLKDDYGIGMEEVNSPTNKGMA